MMPYNAYFSFRCLLLGIFLNIQPLECNHIRISFIYPSLLTIKTTIETALRKSLTSRLFRKPVECVMIGRQCTYNLKTFERLWYTVDNSREKLTLRYLNIYFFYSSHRRFKVVSVTTLIIKSDSYQMISKSDPHETLISNMYDSITYDLTDAFLFTIFTSIPSSEIWEGIHFYNI